MWKYKCMSKKCIYCKYLHDIVQVRYNDMSGYSIRNVRGMCVYRGRIPAAYDMYCSQYNKVK